jgi:hypothetical protein
MQEGFVRQIILTLDRRVVVVLPRYYFGHSAWSIKLDAMCGTSLVGDEKHCVRASFADAESVGLERMQRRGDTNFSPPPH